jgi:Phytanoyl-CoA dioxygenase (PhyH)
MTSPFLDGVKGKVERLQKDPRGVLKVRLQYYLNRLLNDPDSLALKFRRPLYGIWRYVLNREATQLYCNEAKRMELDSLQQQIVYELTENGICIVHFDDLFPTRVFDEFYALAGTYLLESKNQKLIETIQGGGVADQWKFYLIRLLGNRPVFDHSNKFLELSLSDEVLRIVCRYLGMFCRIVDIDLWCNIATPGPASYSQRWHRDPDDKNLIKVFLYLRDVDATKGPFCFVPGSHNGGRFSKVYRQTMPGSHYPPDGEVEKSFSKNQIKVCTGAAGTVILCDTSGLHKGGHPQSGLRVLFTTAYTTNAGLMHIYNARRYSIQRLERESLNAAGRYAIGHLED